MANTKIYNSKGEAQGSIELDDKIFAIAPKGSVVHQVYRAMIANAREPWAESKGKGEIRGGGKKPWKQKGTGHARHGSRRSPIWVGGGITFGPTKERNFSIKFNRTERRKALAMVLSDKVANEKFIVVDSLQVPEIKTKTAAAMLKRLPSGRRSLVILEPENSTFQKSVRNLSKVTPISVKSLNVAEILSNEILVISKPALEILEKTYKR